MSPRRPPPAPRDTAPMMELRERRWKVAVSDHFGRRERPPAVNHDDAGTSEFEIGRLVRGPRRSSLRRCGSPSSSTARRRDRLPVVCGASLWPEIALCRRTDGPAPLLEPTPGPRRTRHPRTHQTLSTATALQVCPGWPRTVWSRSSRYARGRLLGEFDLSEPSGTGLD